MYEGQFHSLLWYTTTTAGNGFDCAASHLSAPAIASTTRLGQFPRMGCCTVRISLLVVLTDWNFFLPFSLLFFLPRPFFTDYTHTHSAATVELKWKP